MNVQFSSDPPNFAEVYKELLDRLLNPKLTSGDNDWYFINSYLSQETRWNWIALFRPFSSKQSIERKS